MEPISLHASRRNALGKKVRELRKRGLVPANVFGHNVPSTALQVDARDVVNALRVAGTHALINLSIDSEAPRTVLVKGYSTDPRSGRLLHVDFYQVGMEEKLRATVPLAFVGEPPAVASVGGILIRGADEVEIECLPRDLPSAITVDLGGLTELDASIHVRDLVPPPGVKILTEPDEVVARIATPRAEKVEEVVPEAEERAASAEETPSEEAS